MKVDKQYAGLLEVIDSMSDEEFYTYLGFILQKLRNKQTAKPRNTLSEEAQEATEP